MSCTENDSGPFVVFFLPAVVGCLTILLARRWANSQVNNTSSTAVSRRRKIIKDPLIKRPLPAVTCKMTQLGSKKNSGLVKKGTSSVADEDSNTCGKRLSRASKQSTTASSSAGSVDFKFEDSPVPPKHIPFPLIPQDGEILFEVMTFIFTLVATGLQFLNLYRTAWWIPNSYNHQAMHFYLIDPHLVAFIVTMISRRLLLSLTIAVLRFFVAPKLMPHATMAARMFILGVILGALAWCAYFIMLKNPLTKIFYLCYPAVVYVLLFGFQTSAFLELSNSEFPTMHSCSHDPQQVRAEVELLRQDFNLRVKKILFNSVVGAYYSSFIPCCFAQPVVYYDVFGASQQAVVVCGALCGRYAAQLAPAPACDVPHRAALHLGKWRRDTACVLISNDPDNKVPPWSESRLWARGARVFLNGEVFVSCSPATAADPANKHHKRFYSVFSNPSTLLCLFLCLQLSLIVLQLCLLFSSIPWHNFISMIILLFINYYTLFKMLRDYLIAWKVYKAEHIIQDKNFQSLSN